MVSLCNGVCNGLLCDQVAAAPAASRPTLGALGLLYGLTRIERSAAFYLAAGVLTGQHAAALRSHVNDVCKQLVADGGRPALRLCEAFGIPDHLLQAPIAFDWTQIGSDGLAM